MVLSLIFCFWFLGWKTANLKGNSPSETIQKQGTQERGNTQSHWLCCALWCLNLLCDGQGWCSPGLDVSEAKWMYLWQEDESLVTKASSLTDRALLLVMAGTRGSDRQKITQFLGMLPWQFCWTGNLLLPPSNKRIIRTFCELLKQWNHICSSHEKNARFQAA